MKNVKFVRVLTLTAALVVALLLLVGTYTIIAGQARSAGSVVAPPVAASGATAWGSGWQPISPGQTITFTHGLGGDPNTYAIDLWFLDLNDGFGINRRYYGGLEDNGQWYGARWQNLTANTITVYRYPNDNVADRISLRVWIVLPPEWDSGWQDINTNEVRVFDHNLGITDTELTASLWFSCTDWGINQIAFGGLSVDTEGQIRGAYWHNLTSNAIRVFRHAGDIYADQVRVAVASTSSAPPDYDSGWRDIAPGGRLTLTHGLNWNPSMMLVRAEDRDLSPGGWGIHQRNAGGDHNWVNGWLGSNVQNLTSNTVVVARGANDSLSDQVRVRIWKRTIKSYLPLLLKNHTPQEELAYDDGTADSYQSYMAGNGFAVRFTTPGASARLVGARYYFVAPFAPIQVHVWDANRNDLIIAPSTVTPSSGGWLDVDLSPHNLTVSGDFYVGFIYTQNANPTLGVDTSAADGRSYEVPWQAMSYDYMIRALVTQIK